MAPSTTRECVIATNLFQIEAAEAGKPHADSWVNLPEWGYVKADADKVASAEQRADLDGYLVDDDGKKTPVGCFVLDLTLNERSKARKAAIVVVVDPTAPGGQRSETDNERLECTLVASQACDADGKRLFTFNQWEELLGCRAGPITRIAQMVLKRAGGTDETEQGNV